MSNHPPLATNHSPPNTLSLLELIAWLGILAFSFCMESARGTTPASEQESFPQVSSKKGLLVEDLQDFAHLGIKHATVNVNLASLIDPHPTGEKAAQPQWNYRGQAYFFHESAVQQLDHRIKLLSDAGALVYLILLAYESGNAETNRILLHPDYDPACPNHLGAFNSVTPAGRDWLAATIEFLAARWSRPDQPYGRVVGYIVGNEVNSHWWWSNCGHTTMQQFADHYFAALRIIYDAVRSQTSGSRVYVSLEHHWSIRYPAGDESQAFPGKDFLEHLAKLSQTDKRGDFPWNIAYHPYPENLFDPRFWIDETAVDSPDSPRITFKNLQVLTEFLKRPEMLYDGHPRRVILSEQGFHAPDGHEGEQLQAAAYCYAYRKVAATDGIDAFIYHRHLDHPDEGGLRLGLRTRNPADHSPGEKRKIYKCFRAADTPQWREAFEFALPIVGLESWPEQ